MENLLNLSSHTRLRRDSNNKFLISALIYSSNPILWDEKLLLIPNQVIIILMQKWKWFVYIIECKDGLYYTGLTWNIDNRIEQHFVHQGSKFTKKH